MPTAVTDIPAYEMQVMEVFYQLLSNGLSPGDPDHAFSDASIADWGSHQFDDEWPGKRYGASFPKINAALGRLRRKGLVEREESWTGSKWGYWKLTNTGRELMGIAL